MTFVENKVVLITGGSRGIGSSMVKRFAESGSQVVFTYRSAKQQAMDLVAELKAKYDSNVLAIQSDASSFQEAETLVAQVIEEYGRIDVLINNAGITRDNLMLRMSEEEWDAVIQTNLKSVFNLTKHALKPMIKAKKGSIINIGSVVGVFGNAGQANYSAAKSGIIGFTKSIAKEVGKRNIRCNVVAPGFIDTDMTKSLPDNVMKSYLSNIPLNRFGDAHEVADACLFLASDLSAYVTGQVVSVCGGLNI